MIGHPLRPCRTCGEESVKGHRYCTDHWSIVRREYARAHSRRPPSVEQRRTHRLWEIYKIPPERFDEILASQGGGCAICGTKTPGGMGRFHIDHDHASGRVRGVLCQPCNISLGLMRDNPTLLRGAAEYLEKERACSL